MAQGLTYSRYLMLHLWFSTGLSIRRHLIVTLRLPPQNTEKGGTYPRLTGVVGSSGFPGQGSKISAPSMH